jgi:hypothetical protein
MLLGIEGMALRGTEERDETCLEDWNTGSDSATVVTVAGKWVVARATQP